MLAITTATASFQGNIRQQRVQVHSTHPLQQHRAQQPQRCWKSVSPGSVDEMMGRSRMKHFFLAAAKIGDTESEDHHVNHNEPPERIIAPFKPTSFLQRWIFVQQRQQHSPSTTLPSETQQQPPSQRRFRNILQQSIAKVSHVVTRWKWARVVASAVVMGGSVWTYYPTVASASAPVMALPKADARDPATDAMMEHQRRMAVKAQAELRKVAEQARKIEAEQGEKARIQFEHEYKQQQEEQAQMKLRELEELKRNLLDQGIDPFCDLEGRRQIVLQEQGLDLGQVPGTPYNMELDLQKRNSPKSFASQHAVHRQIIKCMVQDLKNRQQDPLPYFVQHQDLTASVLDMPIPKAMVMLQQYQNNLQKYGQVVPPKEGELSVLELRQQQEEREADPAVKRQKEREAQRLAKEQAAAERAAKQLQLKQERLKAKEEAQAAKEQAKLEKEQAKAHAKEKAAATAAAVAAAAASTAAMATAAATTATAGVAEAAQGVIPEATTTSSAVQAPTENDIEAAVAEGESSSEPVELSLSPAKRRQVPVAKVSVGVVAVAGSAYGLKLYREKAARDEEERQRQFRLLMGWDQNDKSTKKRKSEPSILDADDSEDEQPSSIQVVDGDTNASMKDTSTATGGGDVATAAEMEAPKRKLGIKSVFKRKSERETDLKALLADAKAPDFTLLLAKILTAGAPGRFPHVVALPGVDVSPTLDLESAQQMLVESRTAAGLTLEESADIFANVVNCMLIDMVDLASTSLKEKEDKATVEAIRIVIDFMGFAASLYDSVAGSAKITPVTYSGTLSKSKLEQMYSAYAVSGMFDMSQADDDFESRVRLLQDVFQINEKKAEGLLMKSMQRNMVKMMKTGEGMEAMEAMMNSGGDMSGLAGLMGNPNGGGELPSQEEFKAMLLELKQLKESGSILPQELETVKAQFREAFGLNIDDITREADSQGAMNDSEKEILELMKYILD